MAQGTFVQALRKEAALSGTFMKGRSLMLNGAVLSIEDSGSRFSKNVTVEGSVRGSRGDLYKTHVALDMDEHEVIDYDCDCPAAYRYPGMCKHAIATALAYLDASGAIVSVLGFVPFAHAGPHVCGAAETARAHRAQSAGRQSQLSLSGARPHESQPHGGALRSFGRAHG